jgi:Na+/H+ antiporter NhaD/arsenite permease-like protein
MEFLIIIIFLVGYLAIAFEHVIGVSKTASALIAGVLSWTIYILFQNDKHLVVDELTGHLGEISGILFFLLGAMTIVELIDLHDGFDIITDRIKQRSYLKLMWTVGFLTFILSPLLDNLTTTIVVLSLLRKLVPNHQERIKFAGIVVIASNAGGAWSPIGDVTTTMLWIGGQISAANIIKSLFIPSLICLLVPLLLISIGTSGRTLNMPYNNRQHKKVREAHKYIVFLSGALILIAVPVFKTATHLPPYMGILIGLGLIWIIVEMLHKGRGYEEKQDFSVSHALRKIDAPSILFFLGILLTIAALDSTRLLEKGALWLNENIGDESFIAVSFGLLSAIVDNVPLVAGAQGMFNMDKYPMDDYFWHLLALTTGTGGSCLIVGSAAGVAAMGMEKINFFWYLKKISWLALLGFLSGSLVFIAQHHWFGS